MLNYLVSGEGRERTAVLGHIYQEVCDPRSFELIDRIRNIKLELDRVPPERADKHLAARRKRCQMGTQRQQEYVRRPCYSQVR